MTLPNDISRCSDDTCIHRLRCLRFLGRNDSGARSTIATCQGTEKEDEMPYPLLITAHEEPC